MGRGSSFLFLQSVRSRCWGLFHPPPFLGLDFPLPPPPLNTLIGSTGPSSNLVLLGDHPRCCFLPSVKLYTLGLGLIFLIPLRGVSAGEPVLMSSSLALLCELWAEAGSHPGISWTGRPDIISQVLRAAAGSWLWGGCDLVAEQEEAVAW